MSTPRFCNPHVILNPMAASGKALRLWSSLEPTVEDTLGPVNVRFTEAPDHATALSRESLHAGADLILVVGGDGTLNEVVNGYLSEGLPINPGASLAFCPAGTGSDFRRSAGIPRSPHDAVKAVAKAPVRRLDACAIRVTSPDGDNITRFFANVTSFGVGGEVSQAAKCNFLTAVNGRAAFLWATARTLLQYRAKNVCLTFDDQPGHSLRVMQVALGNGAYHGGGMNVCPLASLKSGDIDVTVISETGFFDFLRSIPLLYSGDIHSHANCAHYRVKGITATSGDVVLVEVDGEAVGQLPCTAWVLPGILSIAGIQTLD
ncbi:MAG: diacylglycerol kinase family lipid kinase [Chloroflexota bacterium]|nr:diacylglycerol kinase family lipid kinase [Chloroflexota bacterium]MDE2899158.1 diacylglycerol kinase family lipid kinase [Chloroflexota bacterium]